MRDEAVQPAICVRMYVRVPDRGCVRLIYTPSSQY